MVSAKGIVRRYLSGHLRNIFVRKNRMAKSYVLEKTEQSVAYPRYLRNSKKSLGKFLLAVGFVRYFFIASQWGGGSRMC